jgi:hypothetical protein
MAILIEPPQNELSALQNLSDSAGFLKKLGDGNYSIDNNNYLPLSGGTVTNELSVQHISQSGDTWTSTFSASGIELGQRANLYPSATDPLLFSFIDFHSGGVLVDFDARILARGGHGTGENKGGSLEFLASNLSFITGDVYNSKTMTIDGNGNVTIDGTYLGNGSGLTSLNASNISTGTLNAARLPTSYLPLAGGTVTGVLRLRSLGYAAAIEINNLGKTEAGLSTSYVLYNMKSTNAGGSLQNGFHIYSYNNNAYKSIPFTILDNDNVGIGTTSPSQQLDVNGSAKATSFVVGTNQVVSARRTGWAAPTGTATRTTFATSTVTLPQLAERVKGLIDDLVAHGLIGA